MGRDRTLKAWVLPVTTIVIVVVAAVLRLARLMSPGALTERLEYDGAVMLAGSLHLLSGSVPYRDFIFLHPPGSLLLFAPAALASTEPHAMGALRLGIVAAGAANTLLIALLLRRYGAASVVVGAGLYAAWPVVVFTEQLIMLEPILNLCLLGALAAIRFSRSASSAWIAGALLGVAVSIKLWAVIDVALLGGFIAARFGWRGIRRYVAAGALSVTLLIIPLFAVAPAQMWAQNVVAQLTRSEGGGSPAARINVLSLFWLTPAIDGKLPWWFWAVLLLAALATAGAPLVATLRSRQLPAAWSDPAWWGAIAIAHTVILSSAAVFWDHYAAWMSAPLALSIGAATGMVRTTRGRMVAGVLGAAGVIVIGGAQLASPPEPVTHSRVLRAEAAESGCVWAAPDVLVAANAVRSNIAGDCDVDVDPFGASLLLRASSPSASDVSARDLLAERMRSQMERADVVIVPTDSLRGAIPYPSAAWLERRFTMVRETNGLQIWKRDSG